MSTVIQDFSDALVSTFPNIPVRPLVNSDGGLPAITYMARNGITEKFYVNSWGLTRTEIVVSVYCAKYTEIRQVIDTFLHNIHGYSGQMSSTFIYNMTVLDVIETSEAGVNTENMYKAILTVEIVT